MPFPLLIVVPLLAVKGAFLGRLVYRSRLKARADRRFRCRIERGPGPTGHIQISVGTRDLVVYYESGPTADFVVTRRGMEWATGERVDVTDEDLKRMHTTLKAWARARGSTVVFFDA
ncbi:MAG: hypothetical protein M3O26_12025 [Pseudomonadota bacterium]|nr:hypothetical protein [Pseudomonadota bacterium]